MPLNWYGIYKNSIIHNRIPSIHNDITYVPTKVMDDQAAFVS